MRKGSNPDSPTKQIVKALREGGAKVYYWKAISRTKGIPDLVVGYGGITYLLEVKSETGKLSDSQIAFRDGWMGGPIAVVRDIEGAKVAIGMEVAF